MTGTAVSAQNDPPEISEPINLDEALQESVAPDMASSYYYFALSKLNEGRGDVATALSQMRRALDFNRESIAVHLEAALLYEKNGNIPKAIEYAQKASRLDPEDPEPHWVLANIYFRTRNRIASSGEGLEKAVRELEKCRELDPQNERVYYALGGAYFELNQPEKAIRAYEEFQNLYKGSNAGYQEIAKYYMGTNDNEKAVEYLEKALELQPESAESLYLLGDIYTRLRRIEEAVPVYRTLARVAEDNLNIKKRLALFLIETGGYEEAAGILYPVVEDDPDNLECRLLLGRAQIGLEENDKAVETLRSIRSGDTDFDLNARFYLGVALKNGGELPEAIKIFTELLDALPPDSKEERAYRIPFQHQLALSYLENGDYPKSIEQYRQLAEKDPRLNLELMNVYRLNRDFDEALRIGKLEYEKNPGDLRPGILYAHTLAEAGRVDDGAMVLSDLLESDPSNVDLYVHLSQVYLESKRYSEAEETIRNAEQKLPGGNETGQVLKFQLAAVYERQKDYDRAESVLTGLLESDPGDNEAKFRLAAVYERKKDYDRAESLFMEVIKDDPGNAGALNYFGYMLADLGIRLEEAVRYVREALAIDPDNGAYLDSLGWAYFKMNDLENAEKYLLQADKHVKGDPVIYDHLGDLYNRIGDLDKARKYWNESVRVGTEPEEIRKTRRKLDDLGQREQAE
ncbi:MAG: tetratricopeptide repeat protein [Acidobacteria bacterium]|nr:tetratricopeptide repeat protein [Acidobacteriota bacterium]